MPTRDREWRSARDEPAIERLARGLADRFRDGWSKLPAGARRRWLTEFAAGFAAVFALSAALTLSARALENAGWLAWESAVVRAVVSGVPVSVNTAVWMEIPGNSVMLWPVMLLAAGWAAWVHRPLLALALGVGFLLLDPIVFIGWALWDRGRPTLVLGGFADPGGFFNAFPSGHAVQAVFVWGMLAFLWMRVSRVRWERVLAATLALGIAALVTVARLRLGAHWPTDMLAGVILGAAWLAAVVRALRRADAPIDRRDGAR